MDTNQYEIYHETKPHTSPDFPYNTYLCTIPLDFASVPTHWHDEIELIVIKKGEGIVRVDLVQFEVKAGDIIFILPGQLHSIEQKDKLIMEYENILFKPDILKGRGGDFCSDNFLRPLVEGSVDFPSLINDEISYYEEFSDCIKNIDELCSTRPFGYQLAIKSHLFKILFLIISNHMINQKIKHKKSLDKVKLVLSYVHENYAKQISVSEMADICYYSQSHFMKFFKASMGMGFTQYLNEYRLETASRLLLATSDSVLDIAMRTGFENLSYFNRIFKRKYGVAPGQYRRNNRI